MEPTPDTQPASASSPAPAFTPAAVLELAFSEHDFTTQHQGREVQIQTFEPSYDGQVAYIEVNAICWAGEDSEAAVTYRYRIEHVTD